MPLPSLGFLVPFSWFSLCFASPSFGLSFFGASDCRSAILLIVDLVVRSAILLYVHSYGGYANTRTKLGAFARVASPDFEFGLEP
ncbi:hypothetical protein CFAM422_008545 [Trichoderma lentiforme]|uniref:Secreted protein n=1 Tax=Trichoderma lentiforme TaxID=1567552 RepID=A0A9P4XCE8_9HYPO|nr:hypothetical protein CFAM422_008545 [Trichoderma lentiforme]